MLVFLQANKIRSQKLLRNIFMMPVTIEAVLYDALVPRN